jgi:hypothetical protein
MDSSDFLEQLDTLVTFVREHGVFRVKNGDFEVELTVGWQPVEVPVANLSEGEAKSEPVSKEPVRGRDGLTAEDQEALYGRVMDAKE